MKVLAVLAAAVLAGGAFISGFTLGFRSGVEGSICIVDCVEGRDCPTSDRQSHDAVLAACVNRGAERAVRR